MVVRIVTSAGADSFAVVAPIEVTAAKKRRSHSTKKWLICQERTVLYDQLKMLVRFVYAGSAINESSTSFHARAIERK